MTLTSFLKSNTEPARLLMMPEFSTKDAPAVTSVTEAPPATFNVRLKIVGLPPGCAPIPRGPFVVSAPDPERIAVPVNVVVPLTVTVSDPVSVPENIVSVVVATV